MNRSENYEISQFSYLQPRSVAIGSVKGAEEELYIRATGGIEVLRVSLELVCCVLLGAVSHFIGEASPVVVEIGAEADGQGLTGELLRGDDVEKEQEDHGRYHAWNAVSDETICYILQARNQLKQFIIESTIICTISTYH